MREKSANKKQGSEPEAEKSSFEKMEEEVKGTIFNVLYVLLKDDETSHWKHIAMILTDYLQIWFFSFAKGFTFPWKAASVLHYVQVFLDFFQITYWLGKLDYLTYIIVLYILIFIICLVILDIFYVSYSFTKKKFSFVWPLQVLRSVCGLFVTTLFLPFLESFSSIIHCVSSSTSSTGTTAHRLLSAAATVVSTGNSTTNSTTGTVAAHAIQHLHLFPSVACWTGAHIIHSAFAIVVSFIFIIICIVVSLTFFDSNSSSHDISARINSRADVFVVIMKIVLTYLYLFFPQAEYHWFQVAILNLLSLIAFMNFYRKWPYFNEKMNKFFCCLTGNFLWSNVVLIIDMVLEKTEFNGGLQIYFLGLPLVLGLIIFGEDERVKLLMKNINNFQTGEDVALQVRYFLHLIHTKDTDRKNNILLKGYIFFHEDQCNMHDCQLKLYKQSLLQTRKNQKAQKKNALGQLSLDQHQLLLQHAKNMYRQGIQKFPNCTSLKIQYAFFLMGKMSKKQEAVSELNSASQFKPPFDEQFLIFRYQKMLEDYGDNFNDSHGSGLDVVSKFAYESSMRQCQQHIERSAVLHLDFWNCLRDDRPDIAKLNDCGSKINQSIIMVESYWNQLQKLNSNNPQALRMYANFLIEILNDKEAGHDLLARAKDAINAKQNYFDGNNMQEDLNDISALSQNGTSCIYVSGESDKIGTITQCNSGASRVFGYTTAEMRNHNVEKLMPEMYAKNHSKVLDEALSKGPENIPNKERLVFARHKSGYIFPIWLQLKMVQGTQLGVQFVALFKIDKKLITSNIAYILINKERKIQGISSSCMPMMTLDIQKMRRLSLSGIDISKLAPNLFNNYQESNYVQKQGGILDWYLPDFDKQKRLRSQTTQMKQQSNEQSQFIVKQDEAKRISMSKHSLKFNCHLNSIVMGEQGEIGWYLKLEALLDAKQNLRKAKDKERVKQPLFQFRYEERNGKFIRELKDKLNIDNASKDPRFANGGWTQLGGSVQISQRDVKANEDHSSQESENDGSEVDLKDVKVTVEDKDKSKLNDSYSEDIFERRKRWAKGVQTYRLVNGKFQSKEQDEDLKKQQQAEEERKKKLEDEEKGTQNLDGFKNNIKSRKALQMAINDKSVPSAIRNLRMTMNIVILCLLALSITEFIVIGSQFKDINENFTLIQQSYARISETQRIAFDVRSLVMVRNKNFTSYPNYTTAVNYEEFVKEDMNEALNNLYALQNNISLSKLKLSEEHQFLVENKSVSLYFRDYEETLKILKFSLTESVLQIASAVFTVKYFELEKFEQEQEDVFFITYNVYNDFLVKLRQSSVYYVEELNLKAKEKNQFILILFLCSLGVIILTVTILFPVISKVNMARMKVLSLFVDIPNHHVITLATKCEDFISSFQEEEQNDEMESEEGEQKNEDNENNQNSSSKRVIHKQPKNSARSNTKVFVQFLVAAIFVMGYFIAMFIISIRFIQNIKIVTDEMNALAQAEPYYALAYNNQREMAYGGEEVVILNEHAHEIAHDTLSSLYDLNQLILDRHFKNRNILHDEYVQAFDEIYKANLCHNEIIEQTLIPYACETFLSGAGLYGLQIILVRYFETLKETLKMYYELKAINNNNINFNTSSLINSRQYQELYVIQFRYIKDAFRYLVKTLTDSVNAEFNSKTNTRMAAFIVFIIAIVLAYLIMWIPFVSKLNKEIWRTKSMLTIIPIEVILKIPRIQEFLNSQTLFSKKAQAS